MSANINVKNYIGAKLGEAQTIEDILQLYLTDPRPLVCGYSGGKDSSVSVDLVLKALMRAESNEKPTYIMFSDTKLEMAPFLEEVDASFDRMEKFISEYNLNIIIKRVQPKKEHTFSCLFFGAGYQLASTNYRWCTHRWKILPQETAIKELLKTHGGFISITGQRRAESTDRAQRMENATIEGTMLKTHDNSKCNLYCPVEFYSSDDIWDYLYTRSQPWIKASTLGKVYAEAAGDTKNECRTLLEGVSGEQAGCSQSARNGCDICPLFKRDKTLINLAKHHSYLHHVEEFRNWLIDFSEASRWNERDVYMHGKNIQNIYNRGNHRDGMNIPGGMTLAFRKRTLKKYLELDEKIFPMTGTRRVTDFELSFIQERWIEEGEHELGVFQLAPNRTFDISKKHKEILEAVLIYKKKFYREPDPKSISWFPPHWSSTNGINPNADARYYAQLSIQLQKAGKNPIYYAELLTDTLDDSLFDKLPSGINKEHYKVLLKHGALEFIETLPVETKQYYPSSHEEEYVRWEWKNDTVGLMTVMRRYDNGELEKPLPTLFGYEGDFGLQFEQMDELEEKGDIAICESISLEDKMAFFDNW